MSRNNEEKAVYVVSFISSSFWYIEDFSITDERKITNNNNEMFIENKYVNRKLKRRGELISYHKRLWEDQQRVGFQSL
jgi:hypothetical protein